MKSNPVRSSVVAAASLAWLASASSGCTIVTPASPDGGKLIPIRPDALPPPQPLEASVLYVANLQRSSANLAVQYATIMTDFESTLASLGLQIDTMGLIATYADQFGPRLLLGRTSSSQQSDPGSLALLATLATAADAGAQSYAQLLPYLSGTLGNISNDDLATALQLLASSGQFDGDGQTSEAKNVIEFGQGLNANALPAALGGIDRNALFDRPHDLFIVVYLQSLERRCAYGSDACVVDGQAPIDAFEATDDDGGAAWLSFAAGSISPAQVVHLAVATSEGESLAAFRTRCAAVPGFPRNLFDVIEPSDNSYFTPLLAALDAAHPGTGHAGDLCDLMGASPDAAITTLAKGVASIASAIPVTTTTTTTTTTPPGTNGPIDAR